MITIAVVDDESSFRRTLSAYLQKYAESSHEEIQVHCFQDGNELTCDYQAKWDIIFLDIQMAHMDGIETAREIRSQDRQAVILFVTTLAQYAIHGYEVDALDYVLKPLSYAQFELRMHKAVNAVRKIQASRSIFLKKYSDWVKVSTDEVLFVEVKGHTLHYVTPQIEYEKRATIADAEKELAGLPFSRCSQSYLVNLKQVDRIEKDTVTVGGQALPISRNRKKQFLQDFSDYLEANY